jgi:orotidine-5'-phosphate decarboxylase
MQDPKVLVALDYADLQQCMSFVDGLEPSSCRLKVGKEMFTLFGPELVKALHHKGFEVFLDLKFHDIPNTVAKAVAAAAELGVWMVNVHASGGRRMMEAAKAALQPYGDKRPKLIAVTVLTSMEQADLQDLGIELSPQQQVERLASLTQQCGLDGVVCSAHEATALKSLLGEDFLLVTPGIRPSGSEQGDQRRIMTPVEAIAAGSDYLVIGRPITQAASPKQVLQQINQELSE